MKTYGRTQKIGESNPPNINPTFLVRQSKKTCLPPRQLVIFDDNPISSPDSPTTTKIPMPRFQAICLVFFSSMILSGGGTAVGHEGHGHTPPGQGNSLWHYLSEPQHAWVFAAVLTVSVAMVLFYKLQKQTQTS